MSLTFMICVGDFFRREVSVKIGVIELGLYRLSRVLTVRKLSRKP